MPRDTSITEELARPIVDFLALPANAGKKDSEVAAEMNVPTSRVWRARRSPFAPAMTVGPMTVSEANACCDKIRSGMDSVRAMVLDLHDREGWKALGYGSWSACVVAEFAESRSHLYRQLEAGRIEREVSPDGEVGSVPGTHLLPLASLPEGERKAAWDEAVATAPDGKMSARHVESVVNGASRIGDADPPDIARQRANGIIPEGVPVTITDPDPADEDEPGDVQREQTDEEWLAECPAREKLAPTCRNGFDDAALNYRRTDEERARSQRAMKLLLRHRPGFPDYVTSWFNRCWGLKHPKHWVVCKDCDGTGQLPAIGKCSSCHGRGFHG